MALVLSVCGSPSSRSRTARLLHHLDGRLAAQGHRVDFLDLRDLPATALLGTDATHSALAAAARAVELADGLVIGTPVYKAAYSGLLKSLLDLLPQHALAGKTVLPLATGGSTAHALAVDYALRPVLSAMSAQHIVPGRFVLDRHITVGLSGETVLEPTAAHALHQVTDHFSRVLAAVAPQERPSSAEGVGRGWRARTSYYPEPVQNITRSAQWPM